MPKHAADCIDVREMRKQQRLKDANDHALARVYTFAQFSSRGVGTHVVDPSQTEEDEKRDVCLHRGARLHETSRTRSVYDRVLGGVRYGDCGNEKRVRTFELSLRKASLEIEFHLRSDAFETRVMHAQSVLRIQDDKLHAFAKETSHRKARPYTFL